MTDEPTVNTPPAVPNESTSPAPLHRDPTVSTPPAAPGESPPPAATVQSAGATVVSAPTSPPPSPVPSTPAEQRGPETTPPVRDAPHGSSAVLPATGPSSPAKKSATSAKATATKKGAITKKVATPVRAEPSERWTEHSEEQDFVGARSYLSLLISPSEARKYVKALAKQKTVTHFLAKDLLRASRLELLATSDPEVTKDFAKIRDGRRLAPVLLVRGEPLWVADGYHRICASYHLEEDASIPCRIVGRKS